GAWPSLGQKTQSSAIFPGGAFFSSAAPAAMAKSANAAPATTQVRLMDIVALLSGYGLWQAEVQPGMKSGASSLGAQVISRRSTPSVTRSASTMTDGDEDVILATMTRGDCGV